VKASLAFPRIIAGVSLVLLGVIVILVTEGFTLLSGAHPLAIAYFCGLQLLFGPAAIITGGIVLLKTVKEIKSTSARKEKYSKN